MAEVIKTKKGELNLSYNFIYPSSSFINYKYIDPVLK